MYVVSSDADVRRVQIDELIIDAISHQDERPKTAVPSHSSSVGQQIFAGPVLYSLLGALVVLVLLALVIGLVDHLITRRRVAKSGAIAGGRNGRRSEHEKAARVDSAADAVAVDLEFFNSNALDAPKSPAHSKLSDNADVLLLERSPTTRLGDRS